MSDVHGEDVTATLRTEPHVVSVQVDGKEVYEHRSTGAASDAAAAEFALRSWLLGRDRLLLVGKKVQAVVVSSPFDGEATDG